MMENVPEELAGYPVIVAWPVQWGDQDAYGHVNNTVYFRWVETVRIKYLERIQLAESSGEPHLEPILAAIGCNYRRQTAYPDTVRIGVRVCALAVAASRWSTCCGASGSRPWSPTAKPRWWLSTTRRIAPAPCLMRCGRQSRGWKARRFKARPMRGFALGIFSPRPLRSATGSHPLAKDRNPRAHARG